MAAKEEKRPALDEISHGSKSLGAPKPIHVQPGALGFFAASGDVGTIPMKVVGPKNVEVSPDEIITPPDGGWGWFIVFIAFLSNMFVDGTIFSFALIQNEIVGLYMDQALVEVNGTFIQGTPDPEMNNVAWAGSMILGFNFLSGPITSSAADKFGFRAVSMAGAWIAGICFVIVGCTADEETSLPRIWVMLLFYGVIAGLATGMIYMPSVVCVGYYFDKKRALAVGLAISGTGCGTFVMALLTNALIGTIGWRGAILVQGCILFSCSMIGALYRPLEVDYYGDDCFKDLSKMSKRMRVAMADLIKREARRDPVSARGSRMTLRGRPYLNIDNLMNESSGSGSGSIRNPGASVFSEGRLIPGGETGDITTVGGGSAIGLSFDDDVEEVPVIKLPSRADINKPTKRPEAYLGGYTPHERTGVKYVYTVPKRTPSGGEIRRRASHLPSRVSSSPVTSNGEIQFETIRDSDMPRRDSMARRVLRKIASFRIITMPAFWIIALNGLLVTLGYPIPYIYISQLALENGTSADIAPYLLSFLGMANTVGRILCGYFSDWPQVNSLWVNNISGIIAGVVTFFLPLIPGGGAAVYLGFAIIYGASMACFATLRSILIRDFIGLAGLTQAFGLCLSFQGIAAIVSSPMAVMMYKATNTYNLAFMTSGVLVVTASALAFLLPLARKFQDRWDAQKDADEAVLFRKDL